MAAKKEAPAADTLKKLLEGAPRVCALIARPTTQYLGACIVQAPGAWTRVGPTWLVKDVGWLTVGPGAFRWGTTEGLAQLATSPKATPEWHAVGLSIVPTPNLAFAVELDILGAKTMDTVRTLTEAAEKMLTAS